MNTFLITLICFCAFTQNFVSPMEQLSQVAEMERCSEAFYENKTQAELLLFLIFPLTFNNEDKLPTESVTTLINNFRGNVIHGLLLNQLDMYYKVIAEDLLSSKIQKSSPFLKALLCNALDVTAVLVNVLEIGLEDEELDFFVQLSENLENSDQWALFLKDYSVPSLLLTVKKVHEINKKLLKKLREIVIFVLPKKPDMWLTELCDATKNFIMQQEQDRVLNIKAYGSVAQREILLKVIHGDCQQMLTAEDACIVIYTCADFAKRYAKHYRSIKDNNEERQIFFEITRSIFFKFALAFVRLVICVNNEKKLQKFKYIRLKKFNPLDELSYFGGFLQKGSAVDFESIYTIMLESHL